MPSARFFSLAIRVTAYDGVLTKRVQNEQEEAKKYKPGPISDGSEGPVNEVPLSAIGADFIEMR